MKYACSQERIGGIEKHHCHSVGDVIGEYMCQDSEGNFLMAQMNSETRKAGIANVYFDTRADALAALTTLDAAHGLS